MTAPAPATPGVPFRPTVGDALQHAVAHWPDHDFVVTPERRMTYAEAEGESGRLARRMLAAGMGKGTRVGLLFPYGQD
ncbi:MAG TPA: AMP-binding protein [Acidimicrobiia bacterium]